MMRHSNDALTDRLIAHWERGQRIVESGWDAFRASSGLDNATPEQVVEMRKAYMLGAQHLYVCLMHIAETPNYQKYSQSIVRELQKFQEEYLIQVAQRSQEMAQ